MASYSSLKHSEKENLNISKEAFDPVLHSMEFLSQPPIMTTRGKPSTPLTPFTGYHQFRVWIPERQITEGTSRSSSYCYQITQTRPFPLVYVQPNRRWPLAISFRPSMTPVAYRLRVLPRFIDTQRVDDLIETCSKHLEKTSNSLRSRSFIQLLSQLAEYVTDNMECGIGAKQIAALYPLDVLGLLKRTKTECSVANDSHASFGDSQSHLLPEVQDIIDCEVKCYNTCYGTSFRGQIKLICTLEIKPSTDSECPYELVGMQQIGLRSCACPTRDSRGSAPTSYSTNPSICSPVLDCSPSDQRRRGSRKLSLNVAPRSRSRPILGSVQQPRANLPSESTEITVDGKNYYILVLDDPQNWKRHCLLRDVEFSTIEHSGSSRVTRRSRRCNQVAQKLVEKVRQEPITFSQESSGSPESSQCDKATETDPCMFNPRISTNSRFQM